MLSKHGSPPRLDERCVLVLHTCWLHTCSLCLWSMCLLCIHSGGHGCNGVTI